MLVNSSAAKCWQTWVTKIHGEGGWQWSKKRKLFFCEMGAIVKSLAHFPSRELACLITQPTLREAFQQWVTSQGNFIAAIALQYPIDERATTLTPLHPHSIRMLSISNSAWAQGCTGRMRQAHSRREWGVDGWAITVNSTGGKITTGNHLGAGSWKWGLGRKEVDSGEETTLNAAKQMSASEWAEIMKLMQPALMLITVVPHAWSNQQTQTYHEVHSTANSLMQLQTSEKTNSPHVFIIQCLQSTLCINYIFMRTVVKTFAHYLYWQILIVHLSICGIVLRDIDTVFELVLITTPAPFIVIDCNSFNTGIHQ